VQRGTCRVVVGVTIDIQMSQQPSIRVEAKHITQKLLQRLSLNGRKNNVKITQWAKSPKIQSE